MKALTRRCALALVAALPLAGMADEPQFNVCERQIHDYVTQRLGQTVTRIDIRNYTTYSLLVDHGDALVYVKECDGFHGFEVFGTETTCAHIPHLGKPGSYIRYEGGFEGCRAGD